MRVLSILFLLMFSIFKTQELEDLQEGYFYSEGTKNFSVVNIKRPYDYYKVTSCSDDSHFVRAQFEGGDTAFSKELFRYISAYVDKEIYVVNGTFFLHITIDTEGKMTNLDVTPKVANSEMFLDDLKFAVKRIKKSWAPSKCNGVAVLSTIRIRLNFITESAEQ